jgi:hypothetical protein
MVEDYTQGEGKELEHTHAPQVHPHDHYHVAHYSKGGPLGEWEHRTHWHTHEHNHAELTQSTARRTRPRSMVRWLTSMTTRAHTSPRPSLPLTIDP